MEARYSGSTVTVISITTCSDYTILTEEEVVQTLQTSKKYRDIYTHSEERVERLAQFVEESLVKLYKNQSQVPSEKGGREWMFAFTCHMEPFPNFQTIMNKTQA